MRGRSGDAQRARSFGRPVGRGGIAEIGREQHEPVEGGPERFARDAQREPAARRMADQGESGGRVGLAELGDQIGEIVVELAGIGDVAARPRGAVAAKIDRDRRDPVGRKRHRNGMHFDRLGRRAVRQNRDPVPCPVRRRIEAIGEPGPVARLIAAEVGRAPGVDLHRPLMNRGERRRRPQRPGQHNREGYRRDADESEQPQENVAGERHAALLLQITL